MRHASIRFIGFAVSVPVRPAAERKRGLSGHHRSQPPLLRVEVVFQVVMCRHLVALGLYRRACGCSRSDPVRPFAALMPCTAPTALFEYAGRWGWRYISCVASPARSYLSALGASTAGPHHQPGVSAVAQSTDLHRTSSQDADVPVADLRRATTANRVRYVAQVIQVTVLGVFT